MDGDVRIVTWRIVGDEPLMPAPPAGAESRLCEIAVAAVELAGSPPGLFHPAVLVNDSLRLLDDDGHPSKHAAQEAARPAQTALRNACAAAGMDVYDDIQNVLAELCGDRSLLSAEVPPPVHAAC